MVFFTVKITPNLFSDKKYCELAPELDTYEFSSPDLNEIRKKILRVLDGGLEWVENASIDLFYLATVPHRSTVVQLAQWDNIGDNRDMMAKLLFGALWTGRV